jgi:pyruvate formate lyase activating enzyme
MNLFSASVAFRVLHAPGPVGAIAGLVPTTLLDFPGRIAATVFLGGCNFRCPFCHNPDLVRGPWEVVLSPEQLQAWLGQRARWLEGVCISGGEPTLNAEALGQVATAVRTCKLALKLDTNGSRPEVVEELVGERLVDYVAVDIKASPARYAEAAGAKVDVEAIARTVALLRASGTAHELRTTVIRGLHSPEEVRALGEWVGGESSYVLQPFQPGRVLDPTWAKLSAPGAEFLESLRAVAQDYFAEVQVRA